jgi:hypothetical protein
MWLGGIGRHTLIARGYAADGTFADHVVNVNVRGTSASPSLRRRPADRRRSR